MFPTILYGARHYALAPLKNLVGVYPSIFARKCRIKDVFCPSKTKWIWESTCSKHKRRYDHGLHSCREYQQDVCGISEARVPRGSRNPFDIFRNTITNPLIWKDFWKAYGSPDNHINLFPAGISETNDGDKLLGRNFGSILGKTFEELREGDRFYYENRNVVTLPKQREVRRMTMRNVRRNFHLRWIQRKLFRVFNPERESRVSCTGLLRKSKDLILVVTLKELAGSSKTFLKIFCLFSFNKVLYFLLKQTKITLKTSFANNLFFSNTLVLNIISAFGKICCLENCLLTSSHRTL